MGCLKCDHTKRLITLTSDFSGFHCIQDFSLYPIFGSTSRTQDEQNKIVRFCWSGFLSEHSRFHHHHHTPVGMQKNWWSQKVHNKRKILKSKLIYLKQRNLLSIFYQGHLNNTMKHDSLTIYQEVSQIITNFRQIL